jgi:hypothetical protein
VTKGATDACWIWTGSRHKFGYGYIRHEGRTLLAHRVSWQLSKGEIPSGLCVLHRCDNPPCVNPAHLFTGDHADNAADKVSKGRETAPGAKLTSARVAEIIAARGSTSQRAIAERFGVSQGTVSLIYAGKIWRRPWR